MKPIANTYQDQVALLNTEKPLRVYRNLHTGLWSVKQGIVRFHTDRIFLKDAVFLVNEKVRQRVVQNKRKEVHAYVQGFICDTPLTDGYEVSYNPYKYRRFVTAADGTPVISADRVCLIKENGMKVFASGILTEQASPDTIEKVPVHLL